MRMKFFCRSISPGANGRIWTLNLRVMCWVFYHCTTSTQKSWNFKMTLWNQTRCKWNFFAVASLLVKMAGLEPRIFKIIGWLFYRWATGAQSSLEPSKWCWGIEADANEIFLPLYIYNKNGRIWTLNLRIMHWVFYHCATGAQPSLETSKCYSWIEADANETFLLLHLIWWKWQDLNPESLGLSVSCSTTELLVRNHVLNLQNVAVESKQMRMKIFCCCISSGENGRIWTLNL